MADEPKTPDNDEEPTEGVSAGGEMDQAEQPAESAPASGNVDQAELDAMMAQMNSGNEDESPTASSEQAAPEQPAENAPASGNIDQAELDAMMAQMGNDEKDESPAANTGPSETQPGPAGATNALDQSELDALTSQLGGQTDSAPATPAPAASGNSMDQAELDALVNELSTDSDQPESEEDSLQAEMAAIIAAEAAGNQPADATEPNTSGPVVIGETPVKISAADAAQYAAPELAGAASAGFASINLLDDVQLDVKIELGRTDMYIEDVLRLGTGSVVELDKLAGDPVDIFVNERLVARGEVLVLNDNFCVRINSIHSPVPEHEEG